MPPNDYTELEGYREAAKEAFEKQQGIRERSLIGEMESVGGFNLRFISLRTYAALRWMQNSFVTSGVVPTLEDACFFVWIHCAEYKDAGGFFRTLRNRYYRRRIGKRMNALKMHEIEAWTYEQFQDFDKGESSGPSAPPSTAETAWIPEALAKEYGWDDQMILDMPIARITQYLRLRRLRNNSKYTPYQLTDEVNDQFAGKFQKMKTNG